MVYTFWIAALNLELIIMCNPTILNPGPLQRTNVSVIFQNVRGFIRSNDIGEPNPTKLNINKMSEFQSYIFDTKPDIVTLNNNNNNNNNNNIILYTDTPQFTMKFKQDYQV